MKCKTSTWFEVAVRYRKTTEEGTDKAVTEVYTVDALSFGEAEKKVLEEVSVFVTGEMEVKKIARAAYKEVAFTDSTDDDKWFKVRVAFITFDEKTNKEKKTNVCYLVQASDIANAKDNVDEMFKGSISDYKINANVETSIMDVFE